MFCLVLYLKDKDVILNVRISSDMSQYIEDMCKIYKLSKADFIRMLIKWHKSMMKGES